MKLFVKYFSVLLIGASISSAVNADVVTIPCEPSIKKNECPTDCPTTCPNETNACQEKTLCCQVPMKTDETSIDDAAPTTLNSSNAACAFVKKIAPLCFSIGFLLAYHKLCEADATKAVKTVKADGTASSTTTASIPAVSSCYSKTMDDIFKAIVAVFATDAIKDFLKEIKKGGTDFITENVSFGC